ncbi:MAG TPA: response regulator transcription factor [Acidimicrobiales bacterium]|nr:response regulator transcription factor [Acidimicrobiales bacterium]
MDAAVREDLGEVGSSASTLRSLLLVEDDEDLRLALRLYLSRSGFNVVGEVGRAEDALKCLAVVSPDMIVLDLSLPGMGGLQALPLFLKACPETTVVVFSGNLTPSMETQAFLLGASAVVGKQRPMAELEAALLVATAQRTTQGRSDELSEL